MVEEVLSLKQWRVLNNYTQQDVADRLGVSRQTVANWEKEDITPSELVVYACAKLYKTEPEFIKV